jgi:hypothetical protein
MSEQTEQALGVLAVVAAAVMFTLLYVFGTDTVTGFVSGDLEFVISVVFLGAIFGYLALRQL